MRRQIDFSMTIMDSEHHVLKVTGISKKAYATTLILANGVSITVEDHDVETKDLIQVYGSAGVDYYVSIQKAS